MMPRYSLRKAGLVLLSGIFLAGLAGWTANAMVIAKDGTPIATIVLPSVSLPFAPDFLNTAPLSISSPIGKKQFPISQ